MAGVGVGVGDEQKQKGRFLPMYYTSLVMLLLFSVYTDFWLYLLHFWNLNLKFMIFIEILISNLIFT